jgi:hypothetical protein
MRENPIRKDRTVVHSSGNGDVVCVDVGSWYALCPFCGRKLLGTRGLRSTRKIAKDVLHKHSAAHAGPGGSSA